MKLLIGAACLSLSMVSISNAADLVRKTSPHSVAVTMDKLETAVEKAGANVAARVNHAKAAGTVGIDLEPNEVLIFGNPKIGSPIFVENPEAGLDLPIRVLVYSNKEGETIIAYRKPAALADEFSVSPDMKSFVMMGGALDKLTNAAIAE